MNYGDIYDYIYTHSTVYQDEMDLKTDRASKDPIIIRVVETFSPRTLVDLGCGQGYYVRKLRQEFGIEAIGVEASGVCCEKYLNDVPHVNKDIRAFVETQPHYDFVLCTDVLEHITEGDIGTLLGEIARISPVALYGIANHPEVQAGIELHLTSKPSSWWRDCLSREYDEVQVIAELYGGRFFFILCCAAHQRHLACRALQGISVKTVTEVATDTPPRTG